MRVLVRYDIGNKDGWPKRFIRAEMEIRLLQDFLGSASIPDKTALGFLLDNDITISESTDKSLAGILARHLQKSGLPAVGYVKHLENAKGSGELVVFRKLNAYPATLFMGIPETTLINGWWGRVRVPFLICFVVMISGAIAYRIVWINQIRLEQERSQLQEALRVSNEKWKLALEGAGDGMWEFNSQTGLFSFSQDFFEKLGYTEGELENSGKQWKKLAHPEDLPQIEVAARAYLTGQSSGFQSEYRCKCKDGHWEWFLVRGKAVSRDKNGIPFHILGTLTNITRQKLAIQQLKESEERFRQGFILFPTGVAVVSQEGEVLEANPALCEMFGWNLEEIKDLRINQFFVDRRTSELLLQPEVSERNHYQSTSIERTGIHRNGHTFPVIYTLTLIEDTDTQNISYIARIEDLSKRKSAQLQELATAVIGAQERERARISHELHDEVGQSLTALKFMLNLVQTSLIDRSDRSKADSFLASGQQMLEHLMEEVRKIAYRLRPALIDQLGLVSALRSHLDKTFTPLGLKVNLTENIAGKRFPAEIELCCFRVAQEALTNVLRHSKATEFRVSLTQDSSNLTLSIKDNGMGFDLSRYYSTQGKNKSLGLIGMHERVAANNGHFQIHSSPGIGTEILATFKIS
jgi:PAS domain S-box-containing protein